MIVSMNSDLFISAVGIVYSSSFDFDIAEHVSPGAF